MSGAQRVNKRGEGMQEIKLNLAVEDVNVVLEALGNLPFARVYELVGKIQGQAAEQIKASNVSRMETAAAPGRARAEGA